MSRITLLFLFGFLLQTPSLLGQDILLFPESDIKLLSDLPTDVCIRQVTQIKLDPNAPDTTLLAQKRQYALQLMNQGKHEYAKEVLEDLVAINRKVYGTQDVRYAHALVDLARVYILLIRYMEAGGMFLETLNILAKAEGKTSRKYLAALNESVMVYYRVRDYEKAAELSQQTLDLLSANKQKNELLHSIVLNNLAASQKNLGKFDFATPNFQKALTLAKKHPRQAISIAANLAEIYALSGKHTEAQKLLDQYLPIAKKLISSKHIMHARVWMQYGVAYTAANQYEKAKWSFRKALETNSLTFDKITNLPQQAQELMFDNEFMATCGQAGNFLYIIQMYKQLYQQTGDVQALKDGYELAKTMYKYGEGIINSYISEENKLILFRLGGTLMFDMSTYYAYELYKNTGKQQYLEDAFKYAERSKSTILLNALRSKENQQYVDLPQELQAKEKTYRQEIKALERRFLESPAGEQKEQLLQKMNALKIEVEAFKTELKKQYPEYYQHHHDNTIIGLQAIQDHLLDGQLLIEYVIGSDYAYAFLVSNAQLDMVNLNVNFSKLHNETFQLRRSLSDYKFIREKPEEADRVYRQAARYFHDHFIQPVLAKAKNKPNKLVIVPDKDLGHLPFEVFLTQAPKNSQDYGNYPYLLKEYSISYSYSGNLLVLNETQQQTREISQKGVLAFAAEYGEGTDSEQVSTRRGDNIATIRSALKPLPGAQKEVNLMKDHLYGEFFNGMNANEEQFKKRAGDYGIIHLAMHGVLDDEHPILSSLVFSEDATTKEDNFLRAYEIAQLDLNANLVVLSACETGYGKFMQGEGVMSLAHSFVYAGASSVLMSLWQVNDRSTGEIMKRFYINLGKGKSKDDALRQAKLAYLEEIEGRQALHPAFWAAFVQMGDIEPLDLVCKTGLTFSQMRWLILGGSALLILGLVFWFRRKRQQARENI